MGERDFALVKLNASGHLEWVWQVTEGPCQNLSWTANPEEAKVFRPFAVSVDQH